MSETSSPPSRTRAKRGAGLAMPGTEVALTEALAVHPDDPRIQRFSALCEMNDLHGLAFQHAALCLRRAWLHMNRIDYGHFDNQMRLGALSHSLSKVRDSSVDGLIGIAPDRIDWAQRIVVEAKGGAGAKEAVSRQTAFYALILTAQTGVAWRARTEIISTRRKRDVLLDDALVSDMLALAESLVEIRRSGDRRLVRLLTTSRSARAAPTASCAGGCNGDTLHL